MSTDKKKLYALSISYILVLLAALFFFSNSEKAITALIALIFAVVILINIKKRPILSIRKREVLLLMSAISGVWLVLYYLTGLYFGFYKNLTPLSVDSFFKHLLPGVIVIVSIEIIRYVLLAQEQKKINFIAYAIGIISEMLIFYPLSSVTSFSRFMAAVGETLFPAITANLLYNHISKRYGPFPNIVFRLITTMYIYVLPIYPSTPESLFSFIKVLLPLLAYVFLRMLYEKRTHFTTRKSRIASHASTATTIAIMLSAMMLISCQFSHGILVIATESMTGAINKGDAVVYEAYSDQLLKEDDVIVFNKYDRKVVHRIVDVKRVNGQTMYYTKGDSNDAPDDGYVTCSEIEGVVLFKISYIGYPSIWLRDLFK